MYKKRPPRGTMISISYLTCLLLFCTYKTPHVAANCSGTVFGRNFWKLFACVLVSFWVWLLVKVIPMLVIANLGFNDGIWPFQILVLLNMNWLVFNVLHMTDPYAYLMVESKGVWLALQLILKSKGLVWVYRGIGAGPTHAMYFWFMRYIRRFSLVATWIIWQ